VHPGYLPDFGSRCFQDGWNIDRSPDSAGYLEQQLMAPGVRAGGFDQAQVVDGDSHLGSQGAEEALVIFVKSVFPFEILDDYGSNDIPGNYQRHAQP
jgi:hypothetical protein